MNDKLFEELVESLRDGMGIIRGEIKPSRVFENLNEVKDEYFPNNTLDELEGKKNFIWNTRQLNENLEKNKDNESKWNPIQKDPYNNTVIVCQYCHKNSGYTEEGFRHYVIFSDIKCKNCGKVIVHYNNGIGW